MRIQLITFVTILLAGIASNMAHAQATGADSTTSSVELYADSRLAILSTKQAQINRLTVYKNSAGQYKGYRVMVINTNNRDLAYKTRAEILRYFPTQNVYMAYQAPYFKLKAGDFVKKADAEEFKKDLGRLLNLSLFVISDIIKLTPEEEARLLEGSEKEKENKKN
jgi:hypothetical protein